MTRQFSQEEMTELQCSVLRQPIKNWLNLKPEEQEVENPTPVVSPQIEEGPAHPVGPMYKSQK